MSKALDLINRVSEKKQAIQGTEFVAPPTQDQHIVQVNGLAYKLNPDVFVGQHALCVWRIFENNSIFVRPANTIEAQAFVKALPKRRGIMLGDVVHVWAWHDCAHTFYPWVSVTDHTYQLFDWVNCGYSGTRLYVSGPAIRNAIPAQLRQALTQEIAPDKLDIKGLTPEMLSAYGRTYELTVKSEEDKLKERINAVMRFTGAKLNNVRADGDVLIVDYELPSVNRRVVSRIEAETFKVITAGVCLGRGDSNYHLQTLIPVIEHGYRNRLGDWRY